MSDSAKALWTWIVLQFRIWTQPHRRAALLELIKSCVLLGVLSEAGWQLNTRYFARRFTQMPISLAWAMLTVIFLVTVIEFVYSIVLKYLDARLILVDEAIKARMTASIAAYLSGDAFPAGQANPTGHFEVCVAMALLRLRGSAHERLCELPEVIALRAKWIVESRKGDDAGRRRAVERLALLRDPAAIPAMENALGDSSSGVVASAARGLLLVPSYEKRNELVRSLATRPLLVRVLTARESANDVARLAVSELQNESPRESPHAARVSCADLAALGTTGRDLLRLMSATGEMGDAPAEALGASLTALARGGTI